MAAATATKDPPPPLASTTAPPMAGQIVPVLRSEIRIKALHDFEQSLGEELRELILDIERLSDVSDDTKAFLESYRVAPDNSKLQEAHAKIERFADAQDQLRARRARLTEVVGQIGVARDLKGRQKTSE